MEKQNKLSQWWEYCQQQWFIKRNGNVNSIRYAKCKSLKALAWCESKRTTQPPNHSLLSIFQLHSRAFHHFQLCYQPETHSLTLLELFGIQKNQTTNSQIFFHSSFLPPTSIHVWGVYHQERQVNPTQSCSKKVTVKTDTGLVTSCCFLYRTFVWSSPLLC